MLFIQRIQLNEDIHEANRKASHEVLVQIKADEGGRQRKIT